MSKKRLSTFVLIILLSFLSLASGTEIICSSTTSTENPGLFNHSLPLFEKKTGVKVKVVARGTGAAIEMGKRGDAVGRWKNPGNPSKRMSGLTVLCTE